MVLILVFEHPTSDPGQKNIKAIIKPLHLTYLYNKKQYYLICIYRIIFVEIILTRIGKEHPVKIVKIEKENIVGKRD